MAPDLYVEENTIDDNSSKTTTISTHFRVSKITQHFGDVAANDDYYNDHDMLDGGNTGTSGGVSLKPVKKKNPGVKGKGFKYPHNEKKKPIKNGKSVFKPTAC